MPHHDRLDLARVLLAKSLDDQTLVRKVGSDYEGEQPPALDRSASLALVEQVHTWAEEEIDTAPHPPEREASADQPADCG
jgi:hypothetical protein